MTTRTPEQHRAAFTDATAELAPSRLSESLGFVFETRHPHRVSAWAANLTERQTDYLDCWNLDKRSTYEG